MNRLRSPHTGAPCVNAALAARPRWAVAASPPQRDGGADRSPHGVWVLSSSPVAETTSPAGESLVPARGGNPARRARNFFSLRGITLPIRGEPPLSSGFGKTIPQAAWRRPAPFTQGGLVWRTPAAFRQQKTHPCGGGSEWSGLRGSNSLPVPGAARGPPRGPWTSMDPIEVEAASSDCRELSGNKKPTPVGWV